ncbi:carboxypeptidase regulatory-like domain-containing protein [Thermonema rossianum]|uniref:carboxypeptidase regulatory-like domain-containing protein n=1 Tax=Thermonema rossianum TaxID=55505 RepID=UPI0009FBB0C0|nr:carboxypeptidase regulatory-like domain-containing protein [Thermonema rossianum]
MHRWILLCLCGLLAVQAARAQAVIRGQVTDTQGEPLIAATVIVYDAAFGQIIKNTITDEKGQFVCSLPPAPPDSIGIEIRYIGYATYREVLAATTQRRSFVLQESAFDIEEVKVEVAPVTIKKDTVVYDVASFASEADRNIGEVLKKMPGVEVSPDGMIKYKGMPIRRFYIENLDMLGQRYNIAANNVPWQWVEEVEFYENHQDVKLLDSLGVAGGGPALNLKLTPEAMRHVQLNGETGVGGPFLLWDARLVAVKFFDRHQFIHVAESNNIAKDLEKALTEHPLSVENLRLRRYHLPREDLLALSSQAVPLLPPERYRFNQSASTTLNGVSRLSASEQLRYHVTYLYDAAHYDFDTDSRFFLLQDTFRLIERQRVESRRHLLQAELDYEQNTTKRYQRNTTLIRAHMDRHWGQLEGSNQLLQQLETPYWELKNEYMSYLPGQGRRVRQWVANTYARHLPQQLTVSPAQWFSAETESWRQQASLSEWQTLLFRNQRGGSMRTQWQWQIGTDLQAQALRQNISMNNSLGTKDTLSGNTERLSAYLFAAGEWQRRLGGGFQWRVEGEYSASQHRINQLLDFIPFGKASSSLNWRQGRWGMGLSLSAYRQPERRFVNNRQPLWRTYRQSFVNGDFIPWSQVVSGNYTLSFSNITGGWGLFVSVSRQQGEQNYLDAFDYSGFLETRHRLPEPAPVSYTMTNFHFKKHFFHWRTTWELSGTSFYLRQRMQQDGQGFWFTNSSYHLRSSLSFEKLTFFHLVAELEARGNRTQWGEQPPSPMVWQLRQRYLLRWLPAERWELHLQWEGFGSFTERKQQTIAFMDAGVRYRLRRMSFECQWWNIGNTSALELQSVENNRRQEQRYSLRPLNILCKLTWQL